MKSLGKPFYTLLALVVVVLALVSIAIISQTGIESYEDSARKAAIEASSRKAT